jgi:hypothetical protein
VPALDDGPVVSLTYRATVDVPARFRNSKAGERDHCKMVAIPTIKDEDAKRPNRERDSLIRERSRIVNRMKAAFVRLGIRGFNPKLKRAAGLLDGLRTPEGEPIPPNTSAELRRDMERRRLVSDQIRLNFLTKKAPYKGLGADSEEKHEPVSDIDTAVVERLKGSDLWLESA